MSPVRNRSVLWKLQHRFVRTLQALLDRVPRRPPVERIELGEIKARLEYYLHAVYGRPIRVEPIVSEPSPSRQRAARRAFQRERMDVVSESGDDTIRLPAQLIASGDATTPFERYRCLAVQHAERLTRATAQHGADVTSAIEQDLFQLAESVGVDRRIAATQPGLTRAMESGRRSALRSRDARRASTELERRVEQLVAVALAAPMTTPDAAVPSHDQAAQSVEWARRTAAELAKERPASEIARYRRVAPLGLWDTSIVGAALTGSAPPAPPGFKTDQPPPPTPSQQSRRKRRPPSAGTPDQVVSMEDATRTDGQQQSSSDPNARPVDSAPPADDDTGVPSVPSPDTEDPDVDPGVERGTSQHAAVPEGGVMYRYPEWDLYAKTYHPEGSVVRVRTPVASESTWADTAAGEHAVLIRQVRERFAQLRAHRQRLRRQPNGDEIDLEACVTAFSDFAAGRTPDDRLYATVRATRREMAIMLLIDISASTEARIDARHRVIDIERVSALVAAEAFDALGDAYAINAFSSKGRADVRIAEIKAFAERNTPLTGMRLAALEPSNATRLGAALRHATAELALRPESSRLLLILSDGRPNDNDSYINQDYGAEDSRRAVAEARLAGVTPYCITVDPEEPEEYVGHIFGTNGYRVLLETSQLPAVLVQAVQGLLRR